MAELPGWDRGRLAAASDRDVAAARLLVYARARAPEIRRDLVGSLHSLELDKLSPAARRIQMASDRDKAISSLRSARNDQLALRALLELDDVDEANG